MQAEPGFYPGSSEPQTGCFVYALMRLLQPKRALELGTYRGFTSLHMASAASEIVGCQFVTVDQKDQRSLLLRTGAPALFHRFVEARSEAYVEALDRVDFCFLDTAHTYDQTKLEVRLLWPKITPGGFLLLHDPISSPPVLQAVNDCQLDGQWMLLPTPVIAARSVVAPPVSGLLVLRKPSSGQPEWV